MRLHITVNRMPSQVSTLLDMVLIWGANYFTGIWSKSPIPKSPFTKSPFAERPMLKRALFIGNQLGLVSLYTSVESDKKVLDWF